MAEEWNEHIMSKSISEELPCRPDTMHFLPHLHNCQDCSDPLEDNHTDTFFAAVDEIPPDYYVEFGKLTDIFMINERLEMLFNVTSGLNLYFLLLEKKEGEFP